MNITAIRNEQNQQPLIQLKNINVVFAQKTALQNINLNIYPNSIITIVGPNGGGKSTLLKTFLKHKKYPPHLRNFQFHIYAKVICKNFLAVKCNAYYWRVQF